MALYLFKSLALGSVVISLASCTPEPKEYEASYDFLKSSSSVQKRESIREQRDIAFEKAKYGLKEQIKKELSSFLSLYLNTIGLANQKQIEQLSEYVYMDINSVFEEITQENIEIVENGIMKLTVTLEKTLFLQELKRSIHENFKRDRVVWDRFQEQKSQDLMNSSLEKFVFSGRR